MKLHIPAEILKAAMVYASKDEILYNISCLSFEDGKVIATDGKSLLVWQHGATLYHEKSERVWTKGKDAPEIRQNGKDPDFLLPLDAMARKFIKSANKLVDAFHYDTDTCTLSTGYGQSCILTQKENAEFPSWRKVMPDIGTLSHVRLKINASIITQFAEYAKARKGKGVYGFTLLTTAIDRPFYLMPDGFSDCFIVGMPMRSNRTSAELAADGCETIIKISGTPQEAP